MVAFVLDLTIRDATSNRRSLDDLMRQLWLTHGRADQPYTQAELIMLASDIAGRDLGPFFQSHVVSDVPLPMDSVLALAGLKRSAAGGGAENITEDPVAPEARRNVWRAIVARCP